MSSPTFTLGFKLAELTKQSDMTGMGLLALAIKDAGKDTQNILYSDMRQVIEQNLKPRLLKANVADPEAVIRQLVQYLTEQQALFTMAAR